MDQNEKGAGAMDACNEWNEFLLVSSDTVLCGLCDDGDDKSKFSTAGLTMAQKSFILKDPNIWVGDSGATSDSIFNDMGMQSCKETKSSVTILRRLEILQSLFKTRMAMRCSMQR